MAKHCNHDIIQVNMLNKAKVRLSSYRSINVAKHCNHDIIQVNMLNKAKVRLSMATEA